MRDRKRKCDLVADAYRNGEIVKRDRDPDLEPVARIPGVKPRRRVPRAEVAAASTRESLREMLGIVRAERASVSAADLELARAARPVTRGDCEDADRPCPWLGCRHHLGLEVAIQHGAITSLSYRDLEPTAETCALDVAKRPRTLDEIADLLGVSRERVRQIEVEAMIAFKRATKG